jgi:cyclopropane fatty-acyl-phospholipid synthase-like methyltransferase
VLEVASGTGEHAVFMARRFPELQWQPTDQDGSALGSIAAWAEEEGLANLLPPLMLDAEMEDWPVEQSDAVVCINMVHISPWEATQSLFAKAAGILAKGAPLVLYGPYLEDRVKIAPSNVAFDESLRSRNSSWGLRHIRDMDELAKRSAFIRTARHEMPANNLVLVYRRK